MRIVAALPAVYAVASGQPFDHSFLEREGWVYDTEPSCRAVVAMRDLSPADALRWFSRIQRAFYAESTDVTDLAVFPELLDGFDVDRQKYAEVLHAEETRARTREDFAQASRWGIMGFPTLLVRDGDDLAIVTRGFLPWPQLEPPLTRWIQQRFGPAAEGLVCAVDD